MRQRSTYSRSVVHEKRPRTNEQIVSPTVLLVNDDGTSETLPVTDAIARAKTLELDLIEVSPKAQPPVVKISDIGHFLYQMQKKEKKQKAHSKQTEIKMLRFGYRTEKHDLDRLVDRAKEFLGDRDLVKFVVRLRGRELANKQYAINKLKQLIAALQNDAEIEQDVKPQGNQFFAILRPKR